MESLTPGKAAVPNRAIIEHDGLSIEVYYSMSATDFFVLFDFWIQDNPPFTANNFSMWLFLNISNDTLKHILPEIDPQFWYIMPTDYILKPATVYGSKRNKT